MYIIYIANTSTTDKKVNVFKNNEDDIDIVVLKKTEESLWKHIRIAEIAQTIGLVFIDSENEENRYQKVTVDNKISQPVLDPYGRQSVVLLVKDITTNTDVEISIKAKSSIVLNAFPIDENRRRYKAPKLIPNKAPSL